MLSVSCTYHQPTVNIASMWMHATMKSVLSLNNNNPRGEWKPCAFFRRKFEGKDGRGQRAWSSREQEIYALVSCLLKFKSWNWGTKSHRVQQPQVFGELIQKRSLYPLGAFRQAWPLA